jgi:Protein of unknown function (DUF5132)
MLPVLPVAVALVVGVGLGARSRDLLRASRPALRAGIRTSIRASNGVRHLVEEAREELEGITAEAMAEAPSLPEPPTRDRD